MEIGPESLDLIREYCLSKRLPSGGFSIKRIGGMQIIKKRGDGTSELRLCPLQTQTELAPEKQMEMADFSG